MSYLRRYFQSMGAIDAKHGLMAHIATLPKAVQEAYQSGVNQAKPATYTYKLTRRVNDLASGTRVWSHKRVNQDAKGTVDMIETVTGCHFQLPVSRLTKVD